MLICGRCAMSPMHFCGQAGRRSSPLSRARRPAIRRRMRRKCRRAFLALTATLLIGVGSRAALPLDEHRIAVKWFGNDAPWYEGNIPVFEASDPRLEEIYYYRWSLFRAHQRDLGA